MKTWLGVHLDAARPDRDTVVAWALYEGERRPLAHGIAPLDRVRAEAGAAAERAAVHVYVQGRVVNLTEAQIPSRQAAHLRKALPFMVEEQIAGDLRQTHLALAPQRFGDAVPVAVVAHAQMIAWLETLHAVKLSPTALIPEQLLLPREPGAVSVHLNGARALVRLGECRGFVVEIENLATMLDLALHRHEVPCSRIELSACAESREDMVRADALAASLEERLERPVVRRNYQESLVELLSSQVPGPPAPLNLCQGGYRMSSATSEQLRQWRVAGIGAAASLAIVVLGCIAAGIYMDAQAGAARAEAETAFRQMFPQERRIVNLRRQAESLLATDTGIPNVAMQGLAALSTALGEDAGRGIRLQAVRYEAEGGALTGDLQAESLSQIDRLEQLLAGSGLGARVLAASEEGGVANARIELRRE